MRNRLLGLALILGVVAASCGGGTPEAAGPSEGIAVHGDWTIDIYNEDGTLDRNVSFENALTSGGAALLASLLGGAVYPGTWAVDLFSAPGSQPCVSPTGDPTSCLISQTYPLIEGLDDSSNSINLEVAAQDGDLTLTGSHPASADGEIANVKTLLLTCDQPMAAADCSEASSDFVTFTFKSLDDPVPVSAGQTVSVQVVISFTSG